MPGELTRRQVLAVGGLVALGPALPACEGGSVTFPLAPWHMWGTSATVRDVLQAVSPNPFDQQGKTTQLARINYKRPDTWSFLFGIVLQQAPQGTPSVSVTIRADFNVIAGLGRSRLDMSNGIGDGRGFARLELQYTTPVTQVVPFGTWTTRSVTPPVETSGVSDVVYDLTEFPAEDIQCSAQVFGTSGVQLLGQEYVVEVHSYFAPRCHLRPEWFSDGTQFRGHETGGT